MKTKNYRYYDLILAFFAASLLISNLAATKLIAFGSVITDGGAILFPLVYIFADVLTEVYGYTYARRAIWTGFAVMVLAVSAFTIVLYAFGARIHEPSCLRSRARLLPAHRARQPGCLSYW